MYNIVSAIGIKIGVSNRWEPVILANYNVSELYTAFRRVYITLTVDSAIIPVYLDMDVVRANYSTYNNKFSVLITILGNASLPTQTNLPSINTKTAKFQDAFRAGYSVTPVHPIYGENAAPELRTAVMLTRASPVTSYTEFNQNCLVSVNGFYHISDTDGIGGVLVKDAMTSLKKSNQNQIGILSFRAMCTIEKIPVTTSMVYKQNISEPYASAAYVKLNRDLTNKSVFLVIGGYMHVIDPTIFERVSDDVFKINIANYPILDRYYESVNYLDFSSLPLSSTPRNPSQISIEEMTSDANILAYLTLSQTFFVVLNTPDLFASKLYIQKTGFSGMYISYSNPVYPLVTGIGRHPEYVSTKEDGQYSVTLYDNTVANRIYNTTNPLLLNSVSDSNLPTDPSFLSGAYFLQIGRDL